MQTLHEPSVKTPDPVPEPGTIPYFRWIRGELDVVVRDGVALDPEPWGPLAG